MPSAVKVIFTTRNRLWALPVLAILGALAAFELRGASGGDMRLLVEAGVAGAIGFLTAAAWCQVETARQRAAREADTPYAEVPRRGEFSIDRELELSAARNEVATLRQEVRALEDGLQQYLNDKKAEGQKLRNAIIDLNNDVARLREQNPTSALRPQLEAIAGKFGELAGVRQVVAKASLKMRKVEDLAAQVKEADARVKSAKHREAVRDNELRDLRKQVATLRGDLGAEIQKLVEQQAAGSAPRPAEIVAPSRATGAAVPGVDIEDVVDQVYESLNDLIEGRVQALITGLKRVSRADLRPVGDSSQLAPVRHLPVSHQVYDSAGLPAVTGTDMGTDKLQTLEMRLARMANTIDQLRCSIENMQFSGGVSSPMPAMAGTAEDSGIPSRFRKPSAGITADVPGKVMQSGALAKLFQQNLALQAA